MREIFLSYQLVCLCFIILIEGSAPASVSSVSTRDENS